MNEIKSDKAPARKKVSQTRIQRANRERILGAALDVFSAEGFRGATIDQIAQTAGMSKPNLLYYFPSKEDMHGALIENLLDKWLEPLKEMDPNGHPLTEVKIYVMRKLEMARDFPRESRLFANELVRGAPMIGDFLLGPLNDLVNEKADLIGTWVDGGKLAKVDPRHLIFSIWATTQHYADFDVQVRAVLGSEEKIDSRFEDAAKFLDHLYTRMLAP